VFDVSPCVAVHPSDPAVALLALDAVVQMRGADGTREMPLAEFFAAPTADRRVETILAPDELIVSIRIPPSAGPRRSVYHKAMERNVWAFALVSVAVAVRMESGRIADCRLALGGVAPIPWRAKPAERLLTGATPTAATIAAAADAALAGASPLAHNGYKLPLARALIRRALSEVTTPAPA
jgi:xanthine dehydrogenase YagS FAD-binding subunit